MENNVFTKKWWLEAMGLPFDESLDQEEDDNHDYIDSQLSAINKAAEYFNLPIDDMQYAFQSAQPVILNDDTWSVLENSNSYNIESIGQAILYSKQNDIDIKPYLQAIKSGQELPPALILRYDENRYYLVAGELVLSIYKALKQNPGVLQATLNLNTSEILRENEVEPQENIVEKFIQYCMDELKLSTKPQIIFSGDTEETKDKCSFGYFIPSQNVIWVYSKDRNMADIFRTLAHELVHRKQDEDGLIDYESGETGSEIENEANAKAGILLRNFGKDNNSIYDTSIVKYVTLEESKQLNEVGDKSLPWKIQHKSEDGTIYEFDTPSGNYITVLFNKYEDGNYELSFEALDDSSDNANETIPILSTVLNITKDFIDKNEFNIIKIVPISKGRFKVFRNSLNSIDPSKVEIETEKDDVIKIISKL